MPKMTYPSVSVGDDTPQLVWREVLLVAAELFGKNEGPRPLKICISALPQLSAIPDQGISRSNLR